jgi:predicted component of type VI protein secretion system
MGMDEPQQRPQAAESSHQAFSRLLADVNLELLEFLLDMWRGMDGFRRSNQLPGADPELLSLKPHELAAKLLTSPEKEAVRRSLHRWVQELKLHHAALLEGYQEAVAEGTSGILDEFDPEAMSRELKGQKVKVGPVSLSSDWRPVRTQAIWEEYLLRFRKLRSLEAADYERFHREGFRRGYLNFLQTHQSGGGAGDESGAGGEGSDENKTGEGEDA